ncbi:aminodeoxychorismate lyase [Vibrio ishigakensis]|uniref:Aminodeoxychorismate lyase n=1 Tax=Vibrio ishigakensis TaxID=1481914 RepID=A0A0B8PEA7_9VIBR|nr:aminodeoxychorismate lyase [Vibrio ishigakensis]
MLDINNHIVETTMANLFWVKGNTLYTPSIEKAGVAGIARRLVMIDAQNMGLKVIIGEFELDHLLSADQVFITNAILGIAPVTKITHKSFPIGIITRDLQERINSV